METKEILKEIEKLPLKEKLLLVEKTLRHIREHSDDILDKAVDSLLSDYKSDYELTAFSGLDLENFYEAK